MTTKKFADFIQKQTRSIINVSCEPIFGEYILQINGKKIGVLYQNQCYLFLTDKAKELLPDAKVCRPYKNPAGEADFILVEDTTNQELLCSLFKATYDKFYAWQDLFYDFSCIFSFNKGFMNDIERAYDDFVVLLSSSVSIRPTTGIKPLYTTIATVTMNLIVSAAIVLLNQYITVCISY